MLVVLRLRGFARDELFLGLVSVVERTCSVLSRVDSASIPVATTVVGEARVPVP